MMLQLEQKHLDGLGAQAHRVISFLSIAQFLRCSFSIPPLAQREPGILLPKYTREEINDWNRLISKVLHKLPDIQFDESGRRELTFKPSRLFISLLFVRIVTLLLPIRIKLIVDEPHIITNRFSVLLCLLKSRIRDRDNRFQDKFVRIVVHIRQGDILLPQFQYRQMKLYEYERILSRVIKCISILTNFEYEVRIISSPNRYTLDDTSTDFAKNNYDMNKLESVMKNGIVDFRNMASDVTQEETPMLFQSVWDESGSSFDDLRLLMSADVVIMSKSSFSYVGAFLNNHGIIICPEFWHPRLRFWVDPLSENFKGTFSKKLRKLTRINW